MNDEFEDLLKRWMRDRAGTDRDALRALAGHVAALPPRRQRRGSGLAATVAVVAVLGLAAVVLGPRLGAISTQASPTAPAGPAAFADDPRLAGCDAILDEIDTVFEMQKARWFPLHFPGWWQGAPELEVDDPGLVVIEHERQWVTFGGPVRPVGETDPPTSNWTYRMCIAVGTRDDFTIHEYGPTRFDRIIPVLSAEDIARADHLDPEVFADPSTFPAPERLGPCGGLTDDVQYVFEATPASDFPRHFPAAGHAAEMDVDDVALVVVYRGRSPMPRTGPSEIGPEPALGPNEHDLCVILGSDPATATTFFYSAVDLAGFRVRLDDPSPDAPAVTNEPTGATTPPPAPAWASGAAAALGCDGEPSGYGIGWRRGDLGTTGQATAEAALRDLLERVTRTTTAFPTEEFRRIDETVNASVYAYGYRGAPRALVILRQDPGSDPRLWWVADVASCDPSELGPDFPLDADVGIWRDATGALVPSARLSERADCYRGTKLIFDGRLYVWDPNLGRDGIYDPGQLDAPVAILSELPAGAVDSGLIGGARRLYLAPDGTAVFMVRSDGVQRWPHVKGDSYERTDCN